MCGISCIILKEKNKEFPVKDLEWMTNQVKHRGPDFQSIKVINNIGLGHTRLSIQDLSEKGNQPLFFKDYLSIIFNGEIYNFKELKKILIENEYSFSTNTDTEVVLAAYDFWGENCVSKFNGMWAFIIYDIRSSKIFVSRDRFGIKPIYFLEDDEKFIFGSEIKQLIKYSNRKVNLNRVYDYLVLNRDEHLEESFFLDIKKLKPGYNLTFNLKNGYWSSKNYFQLNSRKKNNFSLKVALQKFHEIFSKSINYRLISDVEIGSCLSGGLDSSSIVTFASKNKNFKAFHVKSKNHFDSDESKYVDILSRQIDFKSIQYEVSDKELLKLCDKVIKIQEEPFLSPSVIMQYFVMLQAKKNNIKVLLDGQGGDEVLLGYERYFAFYLKSLGLLKGLKYFFSFSKNSNLGIVVLFKYIIYFNSPLLKKYVLFRRTSFLKKSKVYLKWKKKIKLLKHKNIAELQVNELMESQLPHLLRYEDKNSMFHSIETRLPFLDYRLVDFLISTDPKFKLKGGWSKFLLRKTLEKKISSEIVWRKNKMGFELNQSSLIKKVNQELPDLIMKSDLATAIFKNSLSIKKIDDLSDSIKWRLYNLFKWELIFKVKV